MRIAHIGLKGFPARFGADRAAEAIVRRLSSRHEITVYGSKGYMLPDYSIQGVRLVCMPYMTGKFTHMTSVDFLAAWHAVLYGNYQLIHLHNIEASFVLPILKMKYPVLTTARGRMTSGNKWGWLAVFAMRLMEIPYALLSNLPTSVSRPDAEEFSAYFHRHIEYVPNGVDPAPDVDTESARTILAARRLSPEKCILFAAGRIIPLKGAHLILEAFRKVQGEYHLLIVGDLSQSSEYGTQLQSLADKRVVFVPFITSPATLLGLISLSTLFVFPSLSEGMSNMLLEVASVGVPALCSDIPANLAILPNQALYFSSGNSDDLADKMNWALGHPEEMGYLGLRAQSWVRENFSWDAIAIQYERLYQDVVEKRSSAEMKR